MADDEHTPAPGDIYAPGDTRGQPQKREAQPGLLRSLGETFTERFRAIRRRMQFHEQRQAMDAYSRMLGAYEDVQRQRARVSPKAIAAIQAAEKDKIEAERAEAERRRVAAEERSTKTALNRYRRQIRAELQAEEQEQKDRLSAAKSAAATRLREEERHRSIRDMELQLREIELRKKLEAVNVPPRDLAAEEDECLTKAAEVQQKLRELRQQPEYDEAAEMRLQRLEQRYLDAAERLREQQES